MSFLKSLLDLRHDGAVPAWTFAAWRARWPSWLRHAPARESLLFVLPATAAALLALYLAMLWQIESPYWAAGTVMIVAQPIRAQVLQKSAARLAGTLLGATAGVLLIQFGESAPEWFVAMLALWAGGCTAYAALLRGFRSYGAVLAGYSALLVATAAWNRPAEVFDIATARAAAVGLGVLCYGVANALFAPAVAAAGLRQRLLRGALALSAAVAAQLRGEIVAAPTPALLSDLAELDVWVQRAASEQPALRRRLGRLHAAVGGLLAMVSALDALARQRGRGVDPAGVTQAPGLRDAAAQALALFELPAQTTPAAWRRQARMAASVVHGAQPRDLFQRAWLDHLATVIDGLDNALLGLQLLDGDAPDELPGGALAFHRDWSGACLNGVRSAAAVGVAGWLWFACSWPDGGSALMMAGILAGLYSGRPNPTAAGKRFLISVGLACGAGLLLKFGVLPMIEGFPALALLLTPFLLLGASAILDPRSADYSAAFNFLFLSQMAVQNRMSYDGAAYLNGSLASLTGTALALLMFAVLRPSSGATRARRMRSVIEGELAELGTMRRPPSRIVWESRMYDRLAQLAPYLSELERAQMFGWLDRGLQLLRLRRLVERRALPAAALEALQQVLRQPTAAAWRDAAIVALGPDSTAPAWLSARLALQALGHANGEAADA